MSQLQKIKHALHVALAATEFAVRKLPGEHCLDNQRHSLLKDIYEVGNRIDGLSEDDLYADKSHTFAHINFLEHLASNLSDASSMIKSIEASDEFEGAIKVCPSNSDRIPHWNV